MTSRSWRKLGAKTLIIGPSSFTHHNLALRRLLSTAQNKKKTSLKIEEVSITRTLQHRHCSSNIVQSPFKDVEIPNLLITEVIWDTVDRFPERTAVKCGLTNHSYTYSEVQRLSFRVANSLRKAGFRKGETIALVLPNCPDFPVILLGALEAELVVSFINYTYTSDEMCHQLKDSGSVCVVTGANQLSTVQAAIKKVEESIKSKPVRRVVVVDIPRLESVASGVTRYSEMVADGIDQSRKITNNVQVNDLALLPYSSGTTGLSKGVCLSQRNIVANIYQLGAVEGADVYSPGKGLQDTVLAVLPFYHISGLVVVMLTGLKCGDQIITLPKFSPDSFTQTMENEKITLLMMVPPLVLFLGDSPKITAKHLTHVRHIFCGAAPIGASEMGKVREKLPSQNHCQVSQVYGMTELAPVATLPRIPAKNLATVGAPVSNTLGKIVDVETGKTLGPNQQGELCFKGPQVMLGYHNNPKATSEMVDSEGWLKTGDLGFYDEDNHFYIQDRLKELIKVKGFQVAPAELEEVLRTHPSVGDVGVIGVPHPKSGEVPVAFVVPEKHKKLTDKEIKDFLSEKLSRHKQVSEVIFVDSIPKSASGKILRRNLREDYKRSHM